MPSTFEPVNVPPELKPPIPIEVDYAEKPLSINVRAVVSIALIVLGSLGAAAGVAWWVHPGAGVAILGLVMVVVGILLGNE